MNYCVACHFKSTLVDKTIKTVDPIPGECALFIFSVRLLFREGREQVEYRRCVGAVYVGK